jgi:predicted protein tyrosine phosphatase
VLSQDPYNFNTRAAGITDEYALIPVDKVLLAWAHEIVCMDEKQAQVIRNRLNGDNKPIVVLGIEDSFGYRDPELIQLIREKYDFRKETYPVTKK